MRLLAGGGLPGVKPAEVTFASNQVRIRLPRDPSRAWGLTQAVVARLSELALSMGALTDDGAEALLNASPKVPPGLERAAGLLPII